MRQRQRNWGMECKPSWTSVFNVRFNKRLLMYDMHVYMEVSVSLDQVCIKM